MGTFIVAGNRSDFPAGEMRAIKLEGTTVLLANIDGNMYAVNNKCPHMGGNLSKGMLSKTVVTCPVHGSQFDVTSGKNLRWMKGSGFLYSLGKLFKPPRDAIKYNVKTDGQQVLIEI
jgi:3-phenylpropionate/trans-cinnamate dioxygenase ferredoxin component